MTTALPYALTAFHLDTRENPTVITMDCESCGELADCNNAGYCDWCACPICGDAHDDEPCDLDDFDDECETCGGPCTWGVPADEHATIPLRCAACGGTIEFFPDGIGWQHYRAMSGSHSDPVFTADIIDEDHAPALPMETVQ